MAAEPLEQEARFLYRCLFSAAAPDGLAVAYGRALAELLPGELEVRAVDVGRVVERRLDAEAIEFYLRTQGGPNSLTQRLHVLFYLAELRPEMFSRFTLDAPARGRAWAVLAWSGLWTPWRWVKGWWQVRRHGLDGG